MVRFRGAWEAVIGGFLAVIGAVVNAAPITVREAIQTARIAELREGDHVSVSPDGERFALMMVRGDVARDGVWLEILSGRMASIETNGSAMVVARLFSRGFGDPNNLWKTSLTLPRGNSLVWQDARHVLFFWTDAGNTVQVFRTNVDTGATAAVTQHRTDVSTMALGLAANGTLLYAAGAPLPNDVERADGRGFAVQSEDFFSLLADRGGKRSLLDRWNVEWFIQPSNEAPRRVTFRGRTHQPSLSFLVKVSPDSRYAIVDGVPEEIPPGWLAYEDPWTHRQIREALEISPNGFIARQLKQLYLVDLASGMARGLVSAPMRHSSLRNVLWSADGGSVVIGPTFIPLDLLASAGGRQEGLLHVEIPSGKVTVLPHEAAVTDRSKPPVRFEIRQSLNDPPKLFAHNARTGRSRMILDPNPRLKQTYDLGRVESLSWQTERGEAWRGLLYYPVNYRRGSAYPLVIQTHGVQSETEFNLYGWGPGTGPGISLYAAQMLAGKGMMVLQTQGPTDGTESSTDPKREAPGAAEGFVAAIDMLVMRGLVDRQRVGLTGFSRTGWHVLYALTHSSFPYAAAIASDNVNGSYVEATFATPGIMDAAVGQPPFGDGLQDWLREAPGFNVERIQAPLRMELQSGPLLSAMYSWEIFSRLRRLAKPVELYVSPHIDRGSHQVQNPTQILACKEGAIDWLDFWLNDREDADLTKVEQYARWRELREHAPK